MRQRALPALLVMSIVVAVPFMGPTSTSAAPVPVAVPVPVPVPIRCLRGVPDFMPAVVGLSVARARVLLIPWGKPQLSGPADDDTLVIGQVPAAGEIACRDEVPVTLVVAHCEVPDVVGDRVVDAEEEVRRAGFTPETSGQRDRAVVRRQDPAGGPVICPGPRQVQLYSAPARCGLVPDVVSQSVGGATEVLHGRFFNVVLDRDAALDDEVTGQEPSAGTELCSLAQVLGSVHLTTRAAAVTTVPEKPTTPLEPGTTAGNEPMPPFPPPVPASPAGPPRSTSPTVAATSIVATTTTVAAAATSRPSSGPSTTSAGAASTSPSSNPVTTVAPTTSSASTSTSASTLVPTTTSPAKPDSGRPLVPWLVVTGAGALLIVSFVTGRVLRRPRRLGLQGDVEVRVLHGDEPDIQYHDDGGHAPAMRVHLETGELVDAIHPGGATEVEHHE